MSWIDEPAGDLDVPLQEDAAGGVAVAEDDPERVRVGAEILRLGEERDARHAVDRGAAGDAGLRARTVFFDQADQRAGDRVLAVRELSKSYDQKQLWQSLTPFLQPGRELKARYAFDDLWEETHGTP